MIYLEHYMLKAIIAPGCLTIISLINCSIVNTSPPLEASVEEHRSGEVGCYSVAVQVTEPFQLVACPQLQTGQGHAAARRESLGETGKERLPPSTVNR